MKYCYTILGIYLLMSITALAQSPQIRHDTLNDAPRVSMPLEVINVPVSKAAVNPWDRLAVVADYNQNYLGSGVTDSQLSWTGNTTACLPGTISSLAQSRTLQRINYYRRLIGLSDNMTFDGSHNAETQAAALIMLANSNLSHTPPATWLCYTAAGYTGASASNIALGSHSSGAVTQFINDYGSNNLVAGHRRWLLYSRAASFGHGSAQSASAPLRAADAIWVANPTVTPTALPQFIAFPPAGYVPRNIIPYRWSFGIPGADFSTATVAMTNAAGTSLSLTQYTIDNRYGDNTLVWDLANPTTNLAWTGSADKPFAVTISGVKLSGVVQQPYNYTVVAIDPTAVCPGATPITSCSVAVSGGKSSYLGTESIDFNTIQLTSSTAQDDGTNYTDLSCAMQTTITAGSTYTLTVKGYYINNHVLRAWIDYNNNGVFTDPGELVLTGTANSQTTAVTIPLSATTNTLLRMRILADGMGGTVGPCQINAGGQMEDIAVWVQPAPCQSATASLVGSQSITSGQAATLTATLTGASPWSLTLSNGQSVSNISSSPFAFTVAPTTTTTYTISRVANACGTGTTSGTAVVTVVPCSVSAPTGAPVNRCGTGIVSLSATGCSGTYNWYSALSGGTLLATTNPFSVSITQATYFGVSCKVGSCESSRTSVLAMVTPLATAGLIGSQTITTGQTASLSVILSSNGPWSITLSNGQSVTGILTSTYVFTVSPATSTTYSVVAVSNPCGAGFPLSNAPAVVTVQNSNTCTPPGSLTETEMTGTTIRLNWGPVAGASSYTVQYQEVGTTFWTSFTTSSGTQLSAAIAAYYGKSYTWQVRTNCANGQSSALSPIRSFSMTCPVPFNQSEVVSPTGVNLLWSYMLLQASSSFTYNLQWRLQGASTWNTILGVCCSGFALNSLTTGQAYEWRVQTICLSGITTNYTTPRSFTTGCGAPGGIGYGLISSNSAQISWAYMPGIFAYDLQWRPTGAPSFSMVSGISGVGYSLTGLTNNTTYEVQVRAVCSTSATSAFSSSSYFQTNCSKPNPILGSITPSAARLNWSYMGSGVRYNLVWRQVGSPISTTVSSLSTISYDLTGLMGNTPYEFQVQSICTDGNLSGLSSPLSFTTPACSVPANLNPTAFTNAAVLRWSILTPNIQYILNWRQVGSSAWNSLTAVTPTVYLGDLAPGTAFEWRVQAVCSAIESSSFSNPSTFTTTGCVQPSSLTASTYAIQALVSWQAPGFGLSSDLQWRVQGSSTWNTVSNITEQGPITTPTVSYWLRNLQPGATYEWRVQTNCSPGNSAGYTPINSFSITNECLTPSFPEVVLRTPTFCQVRWRIYAPQSELRWRISGSNGAWISSGPLSTTASVMDYTITALQPNTAYEWQTKAICSDGSSTTYINGFVFQTPACALPGISQVAGTNSARLNWSNTGSSYELQYRAIPVGACNANTSSSANPWISVATNLTAQTQLLSGLTPNTCYQWQVRANCSPESVWVTGYFSTTCGQVLTDLSVSNITGNSAQLGWSDLGSGNSYEVQWRASGNNALTSSDGCINNTTSSANPWTSLTVTNSAQTSLTGLNLTSCYQWRVRQICGTGTEPFTPVQIFRTVATICTGPLVSIQPGDWNSPATWSCNRVPTSADDVVLKHPVTVPAGYTGQARNISYDVGSKLIFQTSAKIRLGP